MANLRESLSYEPVELKFGTSGLRGLVTDMTDLECYINTAGFMQFLEASEGIKSGSIIYLAGDLRDSTPRIMAAVQAAIEDAGHVVSYLGLIPTPALAFYALEHQSSGIMVTGSHIPADRNGIKFYKSAGEVLKADEAGIKSAVTIARSNIYGQDLSTTRFNANGMITNAPTLPETVVQAATDYLERYTRVFSSETFAGKKLVFYQHSAVGRDLLVDLFRKLGAEVEPVDRAETFIPIDTEDVTPENKAYFKKLAETHPGVFAIISTDGDSDRPFVIDETGEFHRGDVLGAVVTDWLKADFAAFPISVNDAVDQHLTERGVEWKHTKIGSPHVIVAMQEAEAAGKKRVVGWEVNGGFLTGSAFDVNGQKLAALPTRDAAFPIIVALVAAAKSNQKVSDIFAKLPQRFTGSGLIDNFPIDVAKSIVAKFANDTDEIKAELATYFSSERGFGAIKSINSLDGARIFFDNGDIAHLRPSGNAPQLRIYSVANTQERADEIVELAIVEPDGIFRAMESKN